MLPFRIPFENDTTFTLQDKAIIKVFTNLQFHELPLHQQIDAWHSEVILRYHQDKQLAIPIEQLTQLIKSSIIIINLDHIFNKFHLENGIIRAIYNQSSNQMVTKAFDAEVYYQLAPGKNINSAVKLYSVNESIPTVNIAITQIIRPAVEEQPLNAVVNELAGLVFAKITQVLHEFEFPVVEIESRLLSAEKKEKIIKLFKISKEELEFDESIIGSIISRISIKDHL